MDLKKLNDQKYEEKIKEKQREKKNLTMSKGNHYEESKKRRQDIEDRKFQLHREKRKVANSLRIRRRQNVKRKHNQIEEMKMKNAAKRELIKTQERQAFLRLENMKNQQAMQNKKMNKDLVVSEKDVIKKRELEAQKLERLEAELLQNLQHTQNMEKEAFSQLEHAMIDASKPKRERVNKSRLSKRSTKNL
jgi:hypothetical protein